MVKKVKILSGSHGTPTGQSALGSKRFWNKNKNNAFCAEKQFFFEDVQTAQNYKNVKVYDITKMSKKKFKKILNSEDVSICAWCYSERSNDIIDAVK